MYYNILMKKILGILAVWVLFMYSCSQKQTNTLSNNYDSLLIPQFKANGPGFVALIAENGKVTYQKAYGMANIELGVPMDTSCLFRIGSITKQFTACAILRLAEEGKLSLKDEITKFIPGYPTHGFHITIEHLLSHTSGIKSYTRMKEWTNEVQRRSFKPTELINWFRDEPMDFPPGQEFRYNNSAYFILGYIIEQASGKAYADYLKNEFFFPLGLQHTFYDSTNAIFMKRATGYQNINGRVENADYLDMSQPYSAGALVSTTGDLNKWTEALFNGRVISQGSLVKAHTAYKLNNGKPVNYGYGWFLQNINGVPSIEHGGGINGFTSYCLYVPSKKVFVVLLANCSSVNVNDLAVKMAAIAISKPYENKAIKFPADSLIEYQGVYQSADNEEAIVRFKDNYLYGWLKGSKRLRFTPSARDKFFVEESFTSIKFIRNSNGKIDSLISFDRAGVIHWAKTIKSLPKEKQLNLPESILVKYVGDYQLFSSFITTIRMLKGKLYAKGTDQSEFEIFARSESVFTTEDEDIQFIFMKNSSGKVTKIKIYQADQVMEGEKIR